MNIHSKIERIPGIFKYCIRAYARVTWRKGDVWIDSALGSMGIMKILALSDLHGNLPEVPECDLLILGGDICPDFNGLTRGTWDQKQRHWLDTEFREWLEEIPAEHVVGIAGNHDWVFEKHYLIPTGLRWTYLEDSVVEVEGIIIYGTPWCPYLPSWAFYGSENTLTAAADAILPCDILVTHSPPYGYGDVVGLKYGPRQGQHVGNIPIIKAIEQMRPQAVICGHVHEGYGKYEHKGVPIYSVSMVDEYYNVVNDFMEIEL